MMDACLKIPVGLTSLKGKERDSIMLGIQYDVCQCEIVIEDIANIMERLKNS
jgi:hypothetical protein